MGDFVKPDRSNTRAPLGKESPASDFTSDSRGTPGGNVGPQGRSDAFFVIVIGLAVTVAVVLRWSGLDSQSFWQDEGYSLWISRLSLHDIWRAVSADTSTPLYYILLHYWTACFGTSVFWIRSLSALCATASTLLTYLLGRKILRERTALGAAITLYAISFYQVWYAKEARQYALFASLSLASVYCLLSCIQNRSALRLCGLGLLLASGLYTHNMALFYLPGIAIMWLVYPGDRATRGRVRDALFVFSGVFLLYLPWLPTLRGQLQNSRGMWWVSAPTARSLLVTLCVFSGFDSNTLQRVFRDVLLPHRFHALRLFGFWTWAPMALLIFVLCVLGGVVAPRAADRRKTAALLAYSVTPVPLVFVVSRISNPIYIDKVFLGACGMLPIVLCAPIAFQVGSQRRPYQLIGLLLTVVSAVSVLGYLRRERREDWRGATEYLMKLPESRRLVVIVPDHCQVLFQYYASGLRGPHPPLEVTGLLTKFDPPDPGLISRMSREYRGKTDVFALLSQAMASGRYEEVDAAILTSGVPPRLEPIRDYLAARCASVKVIQFNRLEVRRCFVRDMLSIKDHP